MAGCLATHDFKAYRGPGAYLSMLHKVNAELLKPHLVERAHGRSRQDIGAVQIQKDRSDCQHLAGVVVPALVHLTQKNDIISCLAAGQLLNLPAGVLIASLQ